MCNSTFEKKQIKNEHWKENHRKKSKLSYLEVCNILGNNLYCIIIIIIINLFFVDVEIVTVAINLFGNILLSGMFNPKKSNDLESRFVNDLENGCL